MTGTGITERVGSIALASARPVSECPAINGSVPIRENTPVRDPFITEDGFPSLRDASVSLNSETGEILVQNVLLADNSIYDLALQWRKATQGFEIVELLEFGVD